MDRFFDGFEDASDAESEESFIMQPVEESMPVGWSVSEIEISEVLKKFYGVPPVNPTDDVDRFVWGFERCLRCCRAIAGNEWSLSGITFKVRSINPGALYVEDEIVNKRIRFGGKVLESPDLMLIFKDHILDATAPIFVHPGSEEVSDDIPGSFIDWNIKEFAFWFEKKAHTVRQVTVIIGEEQISPGIFVKKIDPESHYLRYGEMDCLFICLNEATGKRIDPVQVRKKIWPSRQEIELDMIAIHTTRHITVVCKEFDVKLLLFDIGSKKRSCYNQGGSLEVRVVKLGQVVGLLERVDEVVPVLPDRFEDKFLVAYYDLETVQKGIDTYQRVYAYSFKSDALTETVCHYDVNVVESNFVTTIRKYLHLTPDTTTYLFAWNGSRFDAQIIMPLLRRNAGWVGHVVVNGAGELLTATVKCGARSGTIIFRDPCKLFPSTLSEAAETFGLSISKGDVDHDEVESSYVSGGRDWEMYILNNDSKIREYVRKDVDILESIVNNIRDLYAISIRGKKVSFITCFTRSMAASQLWSRIQTEFVRDMLEIFPLNPYHRIETSNGSVKLVDIMEDLIAARVQAPLGKIRCKNVICVDAKSMYPSRAALEWYPCGLISPVSKFDSEFLGMYEVIVRKQNHPAILPYRSQRGEAYDWSSSSKIKRWITSVDVEELIENGADFTILRGFVWSGRTKEYFQLYMTTLYDLRKLENSVALNLHYKILMNALVGSLIQDQLREFTLILSKKQLTDFQKKFGSVVKLLEAHDYEEGHFLCIFKPIKLSGQDENLIRLQQEASKGAVLNKPGILTWFILAYSRKELRRIWKLVENENKDCRMIYCDTDSLVFTNSDHAKSRIQELGLLGGELGQWEIEMEHAEACIIRSKFYALRPPAGAIDSKGNLIGDKVRIKGVKKHAYCRTSESSMLSRLGALRMRTAPTFDERSRIFSDIKAQADRKKPLGPTFDHVVDVFGGRHLEVVDFQMHKKMGGIMKKYIVSEFK